MSNSVSGAVASTVPSSTSLHKVKATKESNFKGAIIVRPTNLDHLNGILRDVFEADVRLAEAANKKLVNEESSKEGASDDAAGERLLARLMSRHQDENRFNWQVQLADKTNLGPMSLEELLQLPNTPQRRIKVITVSNAHSAKVYVSIKFRRGLSLSPFTYEIRGPNDLVESFSKQFDEFGDTMRPAWSWFFAPSAALVPLVLLLGMIAVSVYSYGNGVEPRTLFAGSVFAVFCLFVFSASAPTILNLVFPKCSFSIGKEEERLAILEKIRWGVLVGGAVAIVTSILLSAF